MLCSPVISNVQVTRTLIDGGAGLNVLSVETFDNLQVSYDQLQPTKPFSGVTDGSTVPIGQVRLPVTFGQRNNYRTELIDFDVAHIRLPYNAILGYPALAKFMAVTHHGYNVLKMPGSGGVITVPCEERDAVCSLERAFQAAAIEDPDHGSGRPPEVTLKKKKTSSGPSHKQAPPEVLRQDLRPIREHRPLAHRKAHRGPSSGRARGLSLGEPPTLPRSRGRRSGTTWRGAFRHASLRKVQVKGDQTLRSSSQGTPKSYKSPESCAAAAAYLPWPHIQARMEDCASASTYQGSTELRPRSAYGLRP